MAEIQHRDMLLELLPAAQPSALVHDLSAFAREQTALDTDTTAAFSAGLTTAAFSAGLV
jgi:hypothetical protein